MRRNRITWLATAAVTLALAGGASSQQTHSLRIGGGSPGSSVQAGAAGLSILLNEQSDQLNTTALGTDGATANVRLVESGEAQLGVTAATSLYSSLEGSDAFANEEPYMEWRAVIPQGFVPLYGVATEDSGITSLDDIAGRSIALGPAGSGTGATWAQLLPELGLEGDFRHMPFGEGNQRLRDGLVDAHLMGVRRIAASIEAESYLGDRAVWFGISDPEHQEAARSTFPALSLVELPANTYETQDEPLETIGYSLWIIAHKDVPDEAVKEVTRIIVEHGEDTLGGYGAWSDVWDMELIPSFDVLEAIGAKLHPGAIAYFEENGHEVPQAVAPES